MLYLLLMSFHRCSLPQFCCFQCSSYKLELLSNQIFHLCCLWVKKIWSESPLLFKQMGRCC
ncbi:hypothetical protein LDENG_00224070 [Lucifuga dentata]|nr:hypothetical protein LDENG_00224070 [Lucifuga dentata]